MLNAKAFLLLPRLRWIWARNPSRFLSDTPVGDSERTFSRKHHSSHTCWGMMMYQPCLFTAWWWLSAIIKIWCLWIAWQQTARQQVNGSWNEIYFGCLYVLDEGLQRHDQNKSPTSKISSYSSLAFYHLYADLVSSCWAVQFNRTTHSWPNVFMWVSGTLFVLSIHTVLLNASYIKCILSLEVMHACEIC